MIINFIKKNKILSLIIMILIFLIIAFICNGVNDKKFIDMNSAIIFYKTVDDLLNDTVPEDP